MKLKTFDAPAVLDLGDPGEGTVFITECRPSRGADLTHVYVGIELDEKQMGTVLSKDQFRELVDEVDI